MLYGELLFIGKNANMKIAVAGSVGRDHLMTFPGKFTDSLVADSLEKVSLSFLVDGLDIRRGGCAANIAFGMGDRKSVV